VATRGLVLWGLTCELSGHRRCGAWPAWQMIDNTAARAKRHAVGAPLEREVRPQWVAEQFEVRFQTGLEALRGCRPRAASLALQ
jgi:hypothetical protein